MSWRDRIKEAAYTSPSGRRIVFQWEETEESFDHRSTIFRFPRKDGAKIKSLGIGEHRFPLTTFLSGDDYDVAANLFMEVLAENGNGSLEHPLYGVKTVQPTNVKRVDKPTTEGNQATISVLFIETIAEVIPESPEDIKKKIEEKQDDFNFDTPQEYENQIKDNTPQESANSEVRYTQNISLIDSILGPIAALNEDVNAVFKTISLSLNSNLTDLIDKPLTLASQMLALIKTPGRIIQSFSLRVQGYIELAKQLRLRGNIASISNDSRNSLLETRYLLSSSVAAMAETMLLEDFKTKGEALEAALTLQDFYNENKDFIESEESKFHIDFLNLLLYGDSEENKNLNAIVQLTAANLANLSFGLSQERIIELARERSIIDLAFELYGNIENETLDLLIESNKLNGEEIILIPRGREIIYYV
jgi:hypothetical protein